MLNNGSHGQQLSSALGVEFVGLDLSKPDGRPAFPEIVDALNAHSLVVIRDQKLDVAGFASAARLFGALQRFRLMQPRHGKPVEHYSCPGEPDVNLIGNVQLDGMPDPTATSANEDWHFDEAYKPQPNRFTVLYAVESPPEGGDTVFSGMQAAYDALDGATKAGIAGLMGLYSIEHLHAYFQQQDPSRPQLRVQTIAANPPASHPIVRVHPVTGRKGLFVVPKVMAHIVGMTAEDSVRLAQRLFDHAVCSEFHYRHKWRNGDFVIWDNHFAMHTATLFDTGQHRRLLYRTMIADGYGPVTGRRSAVAQLPS